MCEARLGFRISQSVKTCFQKRDFYVKADYCYSSKCRLLGDSNGNTQYTFMLKKIEKISLLCLLTWRYDLHSLARTTPVSNIFSWFPRCSSHWSSTVYNCNKILSYINNLLTLGLLITFQNSKSTLKVKVHLKPQMHLKVNFLGPVVRSIVSLTSSLRGQLVKCFTT